MTTKNYKHYYFDLLILMWEMCVCVCVCV